MLDWDAEDLIPRLQVTPVSATEFDGVLESFGGRTFGGEILAKAVMSAALTQPERSFHSVHASFLRAVIPESFVRFRVESLREGRRLSTFRVTAVQAGKQVLELHATFTAVHDGPSFDAVAQAPAVPPPDQLPTLAQRAVAEGWEADYVTRPLDWRYVEIPWQQAPPGDPARWRAWVRPVQALPAESHFHAAALVYLSDNGSFGALERRYGERFDWSQSASIDHAFWLHRPNIWKDWLYVESTNNITHAARGFTETLIVGPQGQRIGFMAQEALFGLR
ncbi:MAG TPA: acyl-CoA thioesterase domain-containing protein [Candidatus Acidoferrales bacterium]|nr:acyl-CoA thioesterase domain-containing protein [Candidatus Acidoferrales bacterium]